MLIGLNLLSHSHTSLSIQRVKIMLLLMLSRKSMLLTQLDVKVHGFESLRDLYACDLEFSASYRLCTDGKACEKISYI
jgi:hypothetical protein